MRTSRLRDQRGTSTLEFIVVLPTLLIIFLGGLELSRAWLAANIATNAAREGARVGVVTPALGANPNSPIFDNSAAVTRITEILTAANLTAAPSGITVTCTPPASPPPGLSGCIPDSRVTASVTINFVTVVPLFLPVLGTPSSPLVLTETTVMRRE
jgi:Flp pilus assembly protein TadG